MLALVLHAAVSIIARDNYMCEQFALKRKSVANVILKHESKFVQ